MPFSRSETAFFHQEDVPGLIDRIASQKSLVVYAGAGVSIDRTGLSWTGLIDNLLKTHMEEHSDADPNGDKRAAIMRANTPVQAASIVSQRYEGSAGDDGKAEIVSQLSHLLYVTRLWQRGELINSLVRLGDAFYVKSRDFYIVTTNYDEFIQREAESLVEAGAASIKLTTSVVDHGASDGQFDVSEHVQPYRVVHLHGRIPRAGHDGTQDIILSELDYIRSQKLSVDVLAELFSGSAVLILGSSLTDQPLIDALARSADAAKARRLPRLAVVPLQGLALPGDSPQVISAVKDSIKLRMAQFAVDVTLPDFFCQVPQFLTEVQICIKNCGPGKAYVNDRSRANYRMRLDGWWTAWWKRRNTKMLTRLQREDYEYLEGHVTEIYEALKADGEMMKLEVWIRWRPTVGGLRQLRLWASSTGNWPEVGSMRTAEIEADSNNASVRAFCLGRPQIYPAGQDVGQWMTSDRWHTYLCVPIRLGEQMGELPVAVLSLASSAPKDKSVINEKNGVALDGVVRKMLAIGTAIAMPERRRRSSEVS